MQTVRKPDQASDVVDPADSDAGGLEGTDHTGERQFGTAVRGCPGQPWGLRVVAGQVEKHELGAMFLDRAASPSVRPTVAGAPARGPPLWEMADAAQGQFDPQAQSAPDYEFDQRIAW